MNEPARPLKWYQSSFTMFVGVLVLGPFLLPLVWKHPTWSRRTKVIWAVGIVALTYVALAGTARLLNDLPALIERLGAAQ